LLIGDSISIGYTVPTRKLLQGKANVHRIPENGGPTTNGLTKLDNWLGRSRWDVIHFNWGLHDLARDKGGNPRVPLDGYEKNLRELVKRLKSTKARLIWASTTPVPNAKVKPRRKNDDVIAYNAAAAKIMEENGVLINDLYAFALPRLGKILLPANVHFTAEGSAALAEKVAVTIERTLSAPTGIPDYRRVAGWPTLPAWLKLGPVSAVATDSTARVYVLQRAEPPVLVFDREGTFLRSWGKGLLKAPHGLRVDRDDQVWVTDTGRHVVMKFDATGKLLLSLGKQDQPGAGPDRFNRPTDVAVGPAGEVYVSDGYGNARVVKFSKEGMFLREWGKKGSGVGEFNLPHAIVVDGKGRVYVGDRENDRVQVFTEDGKFIAQWKASGAPYGLYLGDDRLFVADGRAQWIMVLDLVGKRLGRWDMGSGDSNAPHWVCVDRYGAVYVAYVGGRRVEKFMPK